MAEIEETPAQRQARIRRQKREAKINATGADRLDKITRASGRTPESMRTDSPAPTPPGAATPPINSTSNLQGPPPSILNAEDPAQVKAQEEYLRALLRAAPTQQQPGAGNEQEMEDPMMKMLNQMLGGMDPTGNSNTPGSAQFSPDDISKATGLPSFLTNMLMGNQKAPPTPAEIQTKRLWRTIHAIFAVIVGLYLVFIINKTTNAFGENPPPPATVQNPFVIFVTGEVLVQGTRLIASRPGNAGFGLWIQILRDLAGDGAIVVFILGVTLWWRG